MGSVLVSFWSLIAVMVVGYLLARYGITRPGADKALTRIAFAGAMPSLLFNTVAHSNPAEVFSASAATNVLSACVLVVIYTVVARTVFKMRGGEVTIGALCASYTNAGNLGVAFLTAVAGDASVAAPIIVFQLCVMVPVSFAILDRQTGKRGRSLWRTILAPFTAPPVVGVLLGLVFAATGWSIPAVVSAPVDILAAAAVPMVLIAMGISWRGAHIPRLRRESAPLYFAVFLRCIVGPLLTFGFGVLFGLSGAVLMAVTIAGAFPVANNVFTYAHRYDVGVELSRDANIISTILSLGVTLLIAFVFHAQGGVSV
ncbi:AEC family transporter [Actinomycetaceae bacterium L2_0104]